MAVATQLSSAIFSRLSPPDGPAKFSRHMAVIGAGAAGLVTARELRREGHSVVVFERGNQVGGTWVYDPNVDSDPLSSDPFRKIVHTSLYQSLRTNLPRESMGFRDYPFVRKRGRDSRRFPGHREVFLYLEDFAGDFGLKELVRFETEVYHVGVAEDGKWVVKSRKIGEEGGKKATGRDEFYDGVVICCGHFTEPHLAEIPGVESWPGKQLHSHNYRVPRPFKDKVVVLIGSSASGVDISRDIAAVAKEVHVSSRSAPDGPSTKQPGYDNMWLHSTIERANEDGTVVFKDGSCVFVDIILHCTGYKYHFPFLKINDIVTVDDSRVGPLYKHMFPPSLAPFLSFIGLPWKVIPFPMFELQSKWLAAILAGRVSLPSYEEMMEDVKALYSELEASGWPKRYTHNMSTCQFQYNDWLASQCHYPPVEEWRKQMYDITGENRVVRPETYRDEWEDQELILEAEADFLEYLKVSSGGVGEQLGTHVN
ncbi:flavin-containing monooxygenase FMO GS-OX-like 5 [Aristolochia californica]|uniref:flavin-containing monooxygenase FMO GS-OX-like 5 n=1 Tax=Aristolochia californica TaxID=171875 RepID=UPI0035DABEC2